MEGVRAWLRRELCLSHTTFKSCSSEQFYSNQWGLTTGRYFFYRTTLLLYWTACFLAEFIMSQEKKLFFTYMSHWGQTLILLYFLLSFIILFHEMLKRKQLIKELCNREPSKSNQDLSLEIDLNGLNKNSTQIHQGTKKVAHRLRWYHKTEGVLFQVTFNVSLMVTLLYPIVEDKQYDTAFNSSFLNFNLHVVNFVLLTCDLFINCIPVYLIQFLFTTAISAVYGVTLLTLHFLHVTSKVYECVDWGNHPIQACIVTLTMIFVAPLLCHSVLRLLSGFRNWMTSRCKSLSKY